MLLNWSGLKIGWLTLLTDQAEKYELGAGFHDILWPDPQKKGQFEKHWVRSSLLNTWKKYQLRISPYVSPLKIPLENLGHCLSPKKTKIISYSEFMNNPTEFKSQQHLLAEGFVID